MKISRRVFLSGSSAVAISLALPAQAGLHFHGGGAALNNNRVTINAIAGYLNLAKAFNWSGVEPGNQSADGYPVATPASQWTANVSMPGNYYGNFNWNFDGQGSMQLSGDSVVVTSGGTAITEIGTNSGDASGNVTILSQTNPRVVFAFGWNIQSISNNGSGLIRVSTKTGFFNNGGLTGQSINISGANANTGANATWIVTKIDAQTFDLQGSTFTNAQASPGGTAIYQGFNLSIKIIASGTFSAMSNLVWCKTADFTDISNGLIFDTVLINQWKDLFNHAAAPFASRGWIRFMDLSGVQSNYESVFANRMPATWLNYPGSTGRFVPGYWINAITRGGSDAYTCSDPSTSVWNGSSYIDGAIVQGIPSATNTAGTPTLNVASHGAKPILNSVMQPSIMRMSAGPASAGLNMVYTFTASWLAGLPGVVGTTYTFAYTTVAGDVGSISTLNANLSAALEADTTLATGRVQFTNSAQIAVYPRTAQAGRLTLVYSSGPAICTIIQMDAAALPITACTFVYNYLLDAWVQTSAGTVQSIPFEAIVDACNRTGAHCWYCWGITSGAYVTAATGYFKTNLTAGLYFGTEMGNELWNFSAAGPFGQYAALGMSLGFLTSGNNHIYGYGGLRTKQFATLSIAAWAGATGKHYVLQMSQTAEVGVSSNFNRESLLGTSLNASTNTVYGTYGGLNGSGASPTYDTSPNRPVDTTTAIGCAPYWGSPWWDGSAAGITGVITENVPWLQASKDFTNGLIATAYASLVNQFNGTTTRAVGTNDALVLLPNYTTIFTNEEAQAQQYDSGRGALGLLPIGILHYEGGPQWAMGASAINGLNSVNSTDIAALATQMTNLGWNVSAYTVSGTDNKTEAATQVITMAQAWKLDDTYKNLIKTSYYQQLKGISDSHREVKGAQYGYSVSQWGLFPGSYTLGNQYKNYDAIREFNA